MQSVQTFGYIAIDFIRQKFNEVVSYDGRVYLISGTELMVRWVTEIEIYTCQATNLLGSVVKRFIINLGSKVEHPTKSSYVAIGPHIAGDGKVPFSVTPSTKIQLSCDVSGWPEPNVNWFNVSMSKERVQTVGYYAYN